MPFLASYRRILAVPGAALFSATGLVARLPISMVGLGIVLLVESATGSYGVAGAVSACYMIANAVLAIFQGRLLDRLGQARVIGLASILFGAAMVVFVVAVRADWPSLVSYGAAAVAGASLPQVGSSVRARWSFVLETPADKQTAFALEAVVDEAVFIVGPILVTVLATTVHPVAGLGAAIVVGVLGSVAFAAQRRTAPPVHAVRRHHVDRPAMPWRTVAPLVVIAAAQGVLFGGADVTTVAFAEEQGNEGYAGGLLALWALGSLLAGVMTGAVTWRAGVATRVRWGSAAMALTMAPLLFVDSLPLMGVVLLAGGLAIAPTLIAALSAIEQSVPSARLTEGMAVFQTGLVAGVAPGALLSGVVVDRHGASAAYLVCLLAGVAAALAAQALPRRARVNAPGAVSRAPRGSR